MTLGAGLFPISGGFAGGGAIPATPEQPGPAAVGVAYVNQNGDYEVDGTGDIAKTTPTLQRALILLRTAVGSATVDPALGLYMPTAIDSTWEMQMRQSVYRALQPMTDDGSIYIDGIDIARPLPGRASIAVRYTVLASGESEIASI